MSILVKVTLQKNERERFSDHSIECSGEHSSERTVNWLRAFAEPSSVIVPPPSEVIFVKNIFLRASVRQNDRKNVRRDVGSMLGSVRC